LLPSSFVVAQLFVEKDISVYELKLRALLQLGALKAHDRTDDKTISDAVSGDSSVLLQTISSSEVSGISGGSTTTANTTSTSSTTSNDSTVTTSAIGITSGSASRHRETLKQLIASMRLRTGPSTGEYSRTELLY
jgi:DNA-binding transcriptional regulator LsrR (DeoR family)